MAYTNSITMEIQTGDFFLDVWTDQVYQITGTPVRKRNGEWVPMVEAELVEEEPRLGRDRTYKVSYFALMVEQGRLEFVPDPTSDESGRWGAFTESGQRLLSILAQNVGQARERVREQLDRPGRRGYLEKWIEDGMIVRYLGE